MRKVVVYSLLLVAGLVLSQLLPSVIGPNDAIHRAVHLATMVCLSFIMIHVGYEFDLDKSRLSDYVWDYVVAATAAAFPWIFCALYFIFVMSPSEIWSSGDAWKESLLASRFSSPTSAGVLFAMLAAAGLAATWVFKKARVLAIFDDLDTVLLMIPLKMMMVGMRPQLAIVIVIMTVQLGVAWRFLHRLALPNRWPYVMSYSVLIVLVCELVYAFSKNFEPDVPIHIEVMLPAFVIGCIMARPKGEDPHRNDATEAVEEGPESPAEQHVSTIVSAGFMMLVGLSMPPIFGTEANAGGTDLGAAGHLRDLPWPGWITIGLHVLAITVLSNAGKMFPMLCYRREATFRERLALAIGMFPRGEIGAGVLVLSLSYQITGPAMTVAMLSLAVNLLMTGVFIVVIKRLLASEPAIGAEKS